MNDEKSVRHTNSAFQNRVIEDLLAMPPAHYLWHLRILPITYAQWILGDARITSRAAELLRINPGLKEQLNTLFDKLEGEARDIPSQESRN